MSKDNVVKVKFGEAPVCKLHDELYGVIYKPEYDTVTISELLGVLVMLQYTVLRKAES